MHTLSLVVVHPVLLCILCWIDFCVLLGGYGVLRALHLSANWVARFIGSTIILLSFGICAGMALPGLVPKWLDWCEQTGWNLRVPGRGLCRQPVDYASVVSPDKETRAQRCAPVCQADPSLSAGAPPVLWLDRRCGRSRTYGLLCPALISHQ